MSLPKVKYPTFEVKVPSTGKTIHYRPFLSTDDKILLTAKESGETVDVIRGITQVINNCVIDEDFDINKHPTFDMEYIFLKMRSKSIGNVIDIIIEDDEDYQEYKLNIDLDEVELDNDPSKDRKILLNENIGLIVNYPTPDLAEKLGEAKSASEATDIMIMECIDKVFDEESVYPWKDESREERKTFLENLSSVDYGKIEEFFRNSPKLTLIKTYKNSKGKEKSVDFNTLNDFFILH